MKIALKSLIFNIKYSRNWSTLTDFLQRQFNKAITFVEVSSNRIYYDFTFFISVGLIKHINDDFSFTLLRTQTQNNIVYEQMLIKNYYDNKYKSIYLKNETWVLLRLHKKYNIFNIFVLNSKLSQQYIEFFKIFEKIDNPVYKLNIFKNWRVYSIFLIF